MNPRIFIFRFSTQLIHCFINFNHVSYLRVHVRILRQVKQFSGLNKYISVLERTCYAAGQKMLLTQKKINHLVSWHINNQGRYSLFELFSGRVCVYSSSGNKHIIMDMVIYIYTCYIQSADGITFTLNNQFFV